MAARTAFLTAHGAAAARRRVLRHSAVVPCGTQKHYARADGKREADRQRLDGEWPRGHGAARPVGAVAVAYAGCSARIAGQVAWRVLAVSG